MAMMQQRSELPILSLHIPRAHTHLNSDISIPRTLSKWYFKGIVNMFLISYASCVGIALLEAGSPQALKPEH